MPLVALSVEALQIRPKLSQKLMTELFSMDSSSLCWYTFYANVAYARVLENGHCGCYSCRLACVRCHAFLLNKIPHVTYKLTQKSQLLESSIKMRQVDVLHAL